MNLCHILKDEKGEVLAVYEDLSTLERRDTSKDPGTALLRTHAPFYPAERKETEGQFTVEVERKGNEGHLKVTGDMDTIRKVLTDFFGVIA